MTGGKTADSWQDALLAWRESRDEYFVLGRESPLAEKDKQHFWGLKYFDPNRNLAINVKLHRYDAAEEVAMPTSTGTMQKYLKVGYFDFKVEDKSARLQVYRSVDKDAHSFFIPFKDATSGKESYPACRYVDLEIKNGEYLLDFNYAYNPSCAYNEEYVCPLPPEENWLTVEIRAGEKKYHE